MGGFLVSSVPKSLSPPGEVPILGGRGILGKLRTKVPKSSRRSSSSRGRILDKVRTEVPYLRVGFLICSESKSLSPPGKFPILGNGILDLPRMGHSV